MTIMELEETIQKILNAFEILGYIDRKRELAADPCVVAFDRFLKEMESCHLCKNFTVELEEEISFPNVYYNINMVLSPNVSFLIGGFYVENSSSHKQRILFRMLEGYKKTMDVETALAKYLYASARHGIEDVSSELKYLRERIERMEAYQKELEDVCSHTVTLAAI